jgi:DNA polymerase III subunit epsilon
MIGVGFGQRVAQTCFTAIDFESAGVARGRTDSPVQIGWGTMVGAEIAAGSFFMSYLATDSEITWAAQRVHGIVRADLVHAPRLESLWPQVNAALRGSVILAHGAGTEKRFLRAYPLHGFGPWLDTLALARRLFPGLADYSLSAVIEVLQLKPALDVLCPGLPWHHALYDAVACLVFLRHVIVELDATTWPLERLLGD